MLSTIGLLALSVCCLVSAVLGANKNDFCNGINDCRDAGTTCTKNRCVCWADMGFNVAMTWACDEDASCRVLFPGHVCRPTQQCSNFSGKRGYCQPEGAIFGK